jgi:hypothetical protein
MQTFDMKAAPNGREICLQNKLYCHEYIAKFTLQNAN